MNVRLTEQQDEVEAALRQAIGTDQLQVFYQPQVDLETGELIGAEALLRWHHPVLGSISPARFVPVAEETGLILEIGRFVLETACREAAKWPDSMRIGVNVSPVQFELSDIVSDIRAALANSGLDPRRLDIEITEGLFVDHSHPANLAFDRLRLLGINILLDDFGTGYSSLSYLSRLPIDVIKIDRSFVTPLPDDAEAVAVVTAVMTLAKTLGKPTVAEGIETPGQAEVLRRLGCEIGQGYLFGAALPADALAARLKPGQPYALAS